MTVHILEDSTSVLSQGIETILIPIYHQLDLRDLIFHTKRGGVYDVVEWLLSELCRDMELERVCGLTVRPLHDGRVTVTLELRQPGKQFEECLKSLPIGRTMSVEWEDDDSLSLSEVHGMGRSTLGSISHRAWTAEKFTDTHRPWWEALMKKVPGDLAMDNPQYGLEP
jgi:hypothetical protein